MGFLIPSDLAQMRADAVDGLLTDRCEIRHPDTIGADADGHETTIVGDVAVTWHSQPRVPCSLSAGTRDMSEFSESLGGQDTESRRYILSLPVDVTTGLAPDLVVRLTSSSDPWLVGRPLKILAISGRTNAVVRRVLISDNLG